MPVRDATDMEFWRVKCIRNRLAPGLPESLEQPTGTYLFICLHYRDPVVTEEEREGGGGNDQTDATAGTLNTVHTTLR